MTDSSIDLWRRWRSAGDGHAFAALVVPEIARAVAVARGAGCDPSAAEDVVQEALVGLAVERSDAPVDLGLRVWLYRAVRDRARSSLRSMRRRRRRERSAARPEAAAQRPPRSESAEAVERALAELDADDREAVRLRYTLDLEYREVATILGVSEGAVRVRVHRALERLRARLGGDGAAMLAALPLPAVLSADALVAEVLGQAATGSAVGAASGGAAAVAASGGAIVGSMKVTVAAAAAAFALGAGLTGVAMAPGGGESAAESSAGDTSAPGRAREGGGKDGSASADRSPKRSGRAGIASPESPEEGLPAFADLSPTDDERAWLREALLAERQRRGASAIRTEDSGMEVLRRYLTHGADVEPVLRSFEAAHVHVPRSGGEPVRFTAPQDGGPTDLAPAAGASVLEFGPGRFDLRKLRKPFFDRQKPVPNLEIRGAGKDTTTLLLGPEQQLMILEESQSVTIRDLTIESAGGGLFDVRGGATIALEQVRLDTGSDIPLRISGRAFLACRDSEFEGSGDGIVLWLMGPGLAVFERCRFADSYSAFMGGAAGSGGRPSVVRVLDCEFLDTRLADSRIRRAGTVVDEVDLRVSGGRVELLGEKATEDARRKTWGAEFAASVDGVEFAASPPRMPGADLLRVLELAEGRGWVPLVCATQIRASRRHPPRIDLYFATERRIERKVVEFVGGDVREVELVTSGARGTTPQNATELSGVLPLRSLLAAVPDIATANVASIELNRGEVDGVKKWVASVGSAGGTEWWMVDATSGTVLSRR